MSPSVPAKTKTPKTTRVRKLNRRNTKKAVRTTHKPPNSFRLFGAAIKHLFKYKKLFGGILLIYLLLYVLLVKGLATEFQINELRDLINEELSGEISGPETAAALFGALIGTAGAVSGEAAGVYQIVLFVIFSLIIIRSLRQTYEDKSKTRLKQAFYQSTSQLIPYLLVWLVIILQLIPALLTTSLYGIAAQGGIIVSAFEQILWSMVLLGGIALTVYFVSSSFFAGYIVTLPDMTPLSALRSAKRLVRFQRFAIIRKVLFLPLAILLMLTAVFLPLAFYLPLLAEILFLIVSLAIVFLVHSYFYALYRELL